jgi:large subunit ribosomal protein L7e
MQEADLVRLKREAKAQNGFYCPPEAKLLFVIRIRGLNKIHPKVGSVLLASALDDSVLETDSYCFC